MLIRLFLCSVLAALVAGAALAAPPKHSAAKAAKARPAAAQTVVLDVAGMH